MKIILADAHPEVRTALRLVLEQQQHQILAEFSDIDSTIHYLSGNSAQVLIFDVELLYCLGNQSAPDTLAEVVAFFQALCPGMFLIFLSSRPERKRDCLYAGAHAFFCKSDPPDALLGFLDELSCLPGNIPMDTQLFLP